MDIHNAEAILEVTAGASEDTIQEAFRAKAQDVHPDMSDDPDAEKEFQRIVEARETLLSTDPSDIGSDDSESSSTTAAQEQQTRSRATYSESSREHTTRASTGAAASTAPGPNPPGDDQGPYRAVSDDWTGLSPRELLVMIRHLSLPYLETFRFWSYKAAPVLAALIVGAVVLSGTDGVVGGFPQLAVVFLGQLATVRLGIRRSNRFNLRNSGDGVDDIPGISLPREFIPIIGLGWVLYLIHHLTGAPLAGATPSIVIALAFGFLAGLLSGILYAGVLLTDFEIGLGSIVLASAAVTAFVGFSSFLTPLFFGADSSVYALVPSIMILTVDIGLLANVALSGVLLYSTAGFFIYTIGELSKLIHCDCAAGLNVSPTIWHTASILPITITLWLGSNPALGHQALHVVGDPTILYAICVGSPGYISVLYRVRRSLEMWLVHDKFHWAYLFGWRYYDND